MKFVGKGEGGGVVIFFVEKNVGNTAFSEFFIGGGEISFKTLK